MMDRATAGAGLRPIHPHLLRRTWATRLADDGATVTDLMQQAGWSSVEMVTRYYAGAEERALERVAGLRVEVRSLPTARSSVVQARRFRRTVGSSPRSTSRIRRRP